MYQLLEFYGKWHGFKGRFAAMPAWARFVVGIVALPGIALVLLSILALVVSLVALFIPASLAYRFVSWMTRGRSTQIEPAAGPDGEPEFVAVQQGGGRDVDGDDDDSDRATDGNPTSPVTVTTTVPDPDQRPRRQIEVKIVE